MIKSNLTLSQAIAQFDRSPTSSAAAGYRAQRAEILRRFSLDQWPEMRLEDYALGQPGVEDTYCYWLEYKSQFMGSIRGGAARKLTAGAGETPLCDGVATVIEQSLGNSADPWWRPRWAAGRSARRSRAPQAAARGAPGG